jgi:hypothetical protein
LEGLGLHLLLILKVLLAEEAVLVTEVAVEADTLPLKLEITQLLLLLLALEIRHQQAHRKEIVVVQL